MPSTHTILELPLSKREWKLYKELKVIFDTDKAQELDSNTYHRYEEWLYQLTEKGVLWHIKVDGAYLYQRQSNFDDFESWLKDKDKKARKLNNREWKIAIVGTVIGAMASAVIGQLTGLIPTIASLF